MYQITFQSNESFNIEISFNQNHINGIINNKPFTAEIQKTHPYEYYILHNHHSYNIILLKANTDDKTLVVKINGKRAIIQVKDKFDLLLKQLGMDKMTNKKTESIKAPMPGLVLNVLVGEGQEVKKGDTLLILEAMKMENALKSPHDGMVKKIYVSKGTAVEKNQLLIEI
ncbi:MAG: acetyl-CoA carboxylase biotin carboxyl carrier protein subunit [Bacteroidia bacterium]|nr:acetyl-CoA carboxylase biotin carboxyl carrier protein subunit [Bacteroidia bacterium]